MEISQNPFNFDEDVEQKSKVKHNTKEKIKKSGPRLYNYNEKIKVISESFGISKMAAKYIYHRRRRGYPYKKVGNHNFIQWSTKLQNALIKADGIVDWDWDNLLFSEDVKKLMEHGINVDEESNKIVIKNAQASGNSHKQNSPDIESTDDGWTVVTNNMSKLSQKYILRKIGLLPRPYTKKTY